MNNLKRLAQRCRAVCHEAAQEFRRWVRSRLRRLTDEPGYAEALIRVFLAAIDLVLDSRRLKTFAFQVAEALLAFVRGRDRFDPDANYWQ